jgi:hypothetical protein
MKSNQGTLGLFVSLSSDDLGQPIRLPPRFIWRISPGKKTGMDNNQGGTAVGSIADEVRLEPKAVIEGQGSHRSYQKTPNADPSLQVAGRAAPGVVGRT